LKRIRPFFQKWNPFGWKKNNDENKTYNDNQNHENTIHWKSNYIDYRKKPSDLRNDIIAQNPNNKHDDDN